MRFHLSTGLTAAALGLALVSPAAAQNKPSISIMPTQYFAADAGSAKNVTSGLASQWERQGYTVKAQDQSDAKFTGMGLQASTHYADRVAIRFGRQMGTDLVAYPRLLAVGLPAADVGTNLTGLMEPAAVIHLRVLNVKTGYPIYFRQIAHEFRAEGPIVASSDFSLPSPVADATAQEVTNMYFQRVAGSRQEFGRRR